ncbi:MAG: type II toxin-antitoxin system RelB/DinJ family antitoxin [Patescibacteria group bacterium]|jgi:DNA-damage-inducible protein J
MNANREQIQIRIDSKTKSEAKKILDELGLDMSSAIKLFFRQLIIARNFPCELKDANGFTLRKAEMLRESIADAKTAKKSFTKGSELIKDALRG